MHFSKTYTQILQDLPPELRENAIQYRQLKKLINQIVSELSSLGLSPTILQELIVSEDSDAPHTVKTDKDLEQSGAIPDSGSAVDEASAEPPLPESQSSECSIPLALLPEDIDPLYIHQARVKYEVIGDSDQIQPHLRLLVTIPDGPVQRPPPSSASIEELPDEHDPEEEVDEDEADSPPTHEEPHDQKTRRRSLLWSLREKLEQDEGPIPSSESSGDMALLPPPAGDPDAPQTSPGRTHEVIIPLVSDTKFFNTLSSTLESMNTQLSVVRDDFVTSLNGLSKTISQTALPASASPSFSPHSMLTSRAGSVQVSATQPSKSDLYSWRSIFQLYVEAEVFEHVGEVNGGEHNIEEAEKRLKMFVDQATKRGLADRRNFKLKKSREALQQFIELNLFILNIKKFSLASSEATRKILKKHTKRTALPLPSPFDPKSRITHLALPNSSSSSPLLLFSHFSTTSLPRTLVQAIGETLIPIIPHVDDYSCLICTSIAFKPIRLSCGHLFCVRCLVKMQKRNKGDCPMCRAPVVLSANGSNVDWALLNFMQDWFPIESKEKAKANEKEASEEELMELGIDPDRACTIM